SMVAALHLAQRNVHRTSSYPHYSSVLNLAGIKFPVTCLHYFNSSAKLEIHRTVKKLMIEQYQTTEDDKWLSFRNHCRKERIPFTVYANLECALKKTDSDSQFATHKYQHYNVFSIGYYVHCSYDSSLSGYRFRSDKDCIA
ncbi:hypothetical protein ALC57_05696, partial [Trachymyrmex cornetzi]